MGWKGEAQSFGEGRGWRSRGCARGHRVEARAAGAEPSAWALARFPGPSSRRGSEPQLRVCPSISLLLELTRLLFVSRVALWTFVQPSEAPGKQKGEEEGLRSGGSGGGAVTAGGQTPGLAGGSRCSSVCSCFSNADIGRGCYHFENSRITMAFDSVSTLRHPLPYGCFVLSIFTARGCSSVVERVLSMHEAPGSIPGTSTVTACCLLFFFSLRPSFTLSPKQKESKILGVGHAQCVCGSKRRTR